MPQVWAIPRLSVSLRTEVCHRSKLAAAISLDTDIVDEVRIAAAIVGSARKALAGTIVAHTRLEVRTRILQAKDRRCDLGSRKPQVGAK